MSAIILAGGKSERMGQDKALMPYLGRTLIEHVLNAVNKIVADVVIVADISDKFGLSPSVRVIGDLYPDKGPLGGLITGLRFAGEGSHFVVACDMPFIQPELISYLLSRIGDHDAVIPKSNERLQPLCAVYHSR